MLYQCYCNLFKLWLQGKHNKTVPVTHQIKDDGEGFLDASTEASYIKTQIENDDLVLNETGNGS